jgi:hypothetical protein
MLVPLIGVAVQVGAGAATPSAACSDPTPYRWLPAGGNVAATRLTSAQVAALGAQKAALDAGNPAAQADMQRAAAASPSRAEKQRRISAMSHTPVTTSNLSMDAACGSSGAQRGSLLQQFQNSLGTAADAHAGVDTGYGWAYLNALNQQGQINGYYCGPASVSESSYTEGVGVSQSTAGSWMGTNSNGTGTTAETNGMNNFVGVPVYGWNFYGWVSVPYTPSSADATTFWNNLQSDISPSVGSTLVGDAYEVVNGPHLNGHPNQNIFHYFEIGGWNTNSSQVYYADSATTVWSTVPAYSWFDQWTMVVILGGRGYIW